MSFLTAPINARLYAPQDYGLSAYILSISSILSAIPVSAIANFVVFEKEAENFLSVTAAAIIASLYYAMAVSAVLISLVFFFQFDVIYLWLLPFVLTSGINAIILSLLNRQGRFSEIATGRVLTAMLGAASSILFGLAGAGAAGLLLSNLLAAASILMFFSLKTGWATYAVRQVKGDQSPLRDLTLYNRKLLLYAAPAEILNNVSRQIPVLALAYFPGGQIVTGYYAMATRMISLPADFLLNAMTEWFRSKATTLYRSGTSCRPLVLQMVAVLFFIGLPGYVTVYIFGPKIFSIVLGDKWRPAGEIAKVVGVLILVRASVSPVSFMNIISRKFDFALYMDIVVLSVTSLSFIVGYSVFHDAEDALGLYVAGYSLLYIVTFVASYINAKPS